MLVAVFTVCAYIHIPFAVPFTLGTFALALCLVLAGGKKTLRMLTVYILLGCAGLPVFSSFRGGFAALLEPSGGFILGYFAMTALFALLKKALPDFKLKDEACLTASLLPLYACGSLWYNFVYLHSSWQSLAPSFAACTLPFVLPDIAKVIFGALAAKRLKKYIKI